MRNLLLQVLTKYLRLGIGKAINLMNYMQMPGKGKTDKRKFIT